MCKNFYSCSSFQKTQSDLDHWVWKIARKSGVIWPQRKEVCNFKPRLKMLLVFKAEKSWNWSNWMEQNDNDKKTYK